MNTRRAEPGVLVPGQRAVRASHLQPKAAVSPAFAPAVDLRPGLYPGWARVVVSLFATPSAAYISDHVFFHHDAASMRSHPPHEARTKRHW